MLKLQYKLTLYNLLTKIIIILALGGLVLAFSDDISDIQVDIRLSDKVNLFIKNIKISGIPNKYLERKKFTDFNILKEEYIFLKQLAPNEKHNLSIKTYKTEETINDQLPVSFRVINYAFPFKNKYYLLEIGRSKIASNRLKETIIIITLLSVLIAMLISLVLDFAFNKALLKPFFKIVDQKLNKVNDPLSYNHQLIETTTADFRNLDESISSLIYKIAKLIINEKQFIANVSHELLTPISILIIRLENILNDNQLATTHAQKIYNSIKTLHRLKSVVNSLLLISRVENEQFQKPNEIFIKDLINEVVIELEDRSKEKKIAISNEITKHYNFNCNSSLLHTLFFNLINNAIKYNKEEGQIIFRDKTSNENYYIYIIDNGLGMAKEMVETAFNRFEKSEDEKVEGHGLGLAIVKSIAQFHKIDLEIQSELGEGTTFILRFPYY